MREYLKSLLEGPLKEAFLELKKGSIIYLDIDGESYKVLRDDAGVTLTVPSEKDKPLLVFKINRSAISSLIKETKESIRAVLKKLYLRGDLQINLCSPTSVLLAYGATSMLRKIGLASSRG